MSYIIGIILLIIVLIIVGLILRKRVYDEVDRQESWKMDIMNRDITSQLSRIKKLNLSGETQEKFESWKERWDFIISKELPDIEEYLFDAEEAADRYRFSSAKKTLRKADQILESIEKDIEKILQELDELMDSEESSRKEIEHIQPTIQTLRKQLTTNRFQYGKAEVRFEVELDEIEEGMLQYHQLVESGDYMEAKSLVDELKDKLISLEERIQEFPLIYKAVKQDFPSQIDDLYNGIKEMKEEGYRVEHLSFEKEINQYQQRLLDCVNALEKGETEDSKELITELDERIQEMYQLLEKEAIAKNFIESKIPGYQKSLDEIASSFAETKEEVENLKETYYFDDQDMEKYLSLDQQIAQLHKQYEEITKGIENEDSSHTELREQLELGFEQLESVRKKHDEFKLGVYNLRKDELEAKDKLADMHHQIQVILRKVKKSNIPGVPSYIWNLTDEATEKSNKVVQSLDKHPLDMAEVQHSLSEANSSIERLREQAELMLDQAFLTERVIQYANRYRRKYPILAAKLAESESLFRSYEYELALETAAKALEEVEPGALKRIEENQMVTNSN